MGFGYLDFFMLPSYSLDVHFRTSKFNLILSVKLACKNKIRIKIIWREPNDEQKESYEVAILRIVLDRRFE